MKNSFFLLILIILIYLIGAFPLMAQSCKCAEIRTNDSFLYGRFEVLMKSANGNGIVSSFFLYNTETNCNWPAENNEIDIEMTGNNELIYFTTHHPDPNVPWHYGENFNLDFNPHTRFVNYAIEWEPGIVRWFVEDDLIYTQNEDATNNLEYPMAIIMNLWASDAVDWVGVFDDSVLPKYAHYDHVKYYKYTPDEGNYGTNNNFTLSWVDDFDDLDTSKWHTRNFDRLNGSFCEFRQRNITTENGILTLEMNKTIDTEDEVAVHFSVNMKDKNLSPSDKIYLNGSFNDWCGNCAPMTQNGDVWSLTIDLPAGKYEYLYAINNWEQIGGPAMESNCDFLPCDEWANYGFIVPEDSSEIILDTYCWNTCENCTSSISTEDLPLPYRELVKIFDVFGREIKKPIPGKILFFLYSDGSVDKNLITR